MQNSLEVCTSTFNNGPCCCSVAKSHPTLWPHRLQYARAPCPPLSPGVHSSSCPLSQWCYVTISSSAALFSFCLQSSQHQGLFQWVSSYCQVAKVLELQLQHGPANEYLGLISFRIDWLHLLAVQGTLKSVLQHQKIISSSVLGLLHGSTLISSHDYWKIYSFDYTDFD